MWGLAPSMVSGVHRRSWSISCMDWSEAIAFAPFSSSSYFFWCYLALCFYFEIDYSIDFYPSLIFFFLVVLGIESRDLALSYLPSPFLLFVLRQSLTKSLGCPSWIQTCDSPAPAPQSAGITGGHHHAQPVYPSCFTQAQKAETPCVQWLQP